MLCVVCPWMRKKKKVDKTKVISIYIKKKRTHHDPENEKNESHGPDDLPIPSRLVRREKNLEKR